MATGRFDLDQLGWRAFQQLSHTVLREVLGQTVVSYLDTNDGGRDGGFSGQWSPISSTDTVSGHFVIQCKHTAQRGNNLTKSDLTDEFGKAKRLVAAGRCDVYVLMTNAGISGTTEEAIVDELHACGVRHTIVLGSTWFDTTIAATPRLRRLVPRLYGLGDLTQILDERSYTQARAVLDAMRADLNRLVLTNTYTAAATALDRHAFVLLVGAAATGKTTIAAQLALGAADEFNTAVTKLTTIRDLADRWNPDDLQLFWLDDAFGSTQFDSGLARDWVLAISTLNGAIHKGARFVVTTRDYIYRAARDHLKISSFPLLRESEVDVDVAKLTVDEREQILYNHLRHGRQSERFIADLQPHLESAARHKGFTPELARRLSEPVFTTTVRPASGASIDTFFSKPADFLHDVLSGLDGDSRAALGLVFVHRGWLPSPIILSSRDADLLARLGSTLGDVGRSLADLNGSLVNNVARDGGQGWTFAHPTMADAYGRFLQTPELFHHFVAGFELDVLLSTVTCGDVGLIGAIELPQSTWDEVLKRLDGPISNIGSNERWRAAAGRTAFLADRCCKGFLERWLAVKPSRLDQFRSAGLMLEATVQNELAARLHELGLMPEVVRSSFAQDLIEYGRTGLDPAALFDRRLGSMLTEGERAGLLDAVRKEVLGAPFDAIQSCTEGYTAGDDPSEAVSPLLELIEHLPELYPSAHDVLADGKRLDSAIMDWVCEHESDPNDKAVRPRRDIRVPAPAAPVMDRSTFDDLTEGRHTP